MPLGEDLHAPWSRPPRGPECGDDVLKVELTLPAETRAGGRCPVLVERADNGGGGGVELHPHDPVQRRARELLRGPPDALDVPDVDDTPPFA